MKCWKLRTAKRDLNYSHRSQTWSSSIWGSRIFRGSNCCERSGAVTRAFPLSYCQAGGTKLGKSRHLILAPMTTSASHSAWMSFSLVGVLAVHLVQRIVKARDQEVKLSPKEYDLLRILVQHAGKVLTHRFLLGELWDDLTDAQYLRVYVRQLRQKIEADPERPEYILTETGVGYRLRAPD